MRTITLNHRSLAAAGLLVTIAVARAAGGDSLVQAERAGHYVGTLSCTSASCHGSTSAQHGGGFAWQQVYARWLGVEPKYQDGRRGYDPRARIERHLGDPHAFARLRMQEPPFQEVLRRYSNRPDGATDPAAYQKCASCHDPLGRDAMADDSKATVIEHGIGCESCHGPARQWLATHYRLDTSRGELMQQGMVDTKDLLTRARLCVGCHVGSAENDMNHDMIAAGHPPLRFELASYEALFANKHWDDSEQRRAQPDYEVQLWAAGRIASAEASLALLESRAKGAQEEATPLAARPWPEFAEYDCFACHQSLKRQTASTPQPAARLRAGQLPWHTGNHALVGQVLSLESASAGELRAPGGNVARQLNELRAAMERSLIPDAAGAARLASQARRELEQQLLARQLDNSNATSKLLSALAQAPSGSWDELCQRLAALVAVRRALQDQGSLTPAAEERIRERQHEIAARLRVQPADLEPSDLTAIGQQLDALRIDILAASNSPHLSLLSAETAP